MADEAEIKEKIKHLKLERRKLNRSIKNVTKEKGDAEGKAVTKEEWDEVHRRYTMELGRLENIKQNHLNPQIKYLRDQFKTQRMKKHYSAVQGTPNISQEFLESVKRKEWGRANRPSSKKMKKDYEKIESGILGSLKKGVNDIQESRKNDASQNPQEFRKRFEKQINDIRKKRLSQGYVESGSHIEQHHGMAFDIPDFVKKHESKPMPLYKISMGKIWENVYTIFISAVLGLAAFLVPPLFGWPPFMAASIALIFIVPLYLIIPDEYEYELTKKKKIEGEEYSDVPPPPKYNLRKQYSDIKERIKELRKK